MVIMEDSNTYLLLFCCFFLRGSLCGTSLSIDRCGFSGESVSLSCTLPSAEFTQSITWSNDIIVGDISACIPGGCGTPANSRYSPSADANGIYMTITTLTRAVDETTWKCTLLGQPASTVNLVVRDHPNTCVLGKNSDGSFKCETDCGHPTSDLTIDWFLNTTSAVVDLSNPSIAIDTTSTPACSSGGKASATLPASNINEDGDLYCKCGMQTACPQKAPIVSGSEAATASSKICDSCKKTIALAVSGLFVAVVCVALCLKMYFKFRGKPITYIYVQINTTVTLTCPADDKATKLTWTGPGGIPYVTGTTVEAGLSGSVKQRISARHTGGSYTLTIKAFQSSDMGIYTSKVNGTVDSQMVILEESGGGKGKFECSVTWCFRETSIATVVSVIGFILCIAGLIICVTCDDSVSSSNSVTVGFALAVVGFVLAAVTLVIVIILVILFCRGVITKKDDGQTINHVSVKNNDPLTLTCLAGDLATTLTWTGPGGILYVTGTTVQAGLSDTIKSRISASHTKGSYKLTFTEFRSSDKGTYTSTVDETVVKHEVIVQDNKAVRARPDGQDAKPRTERTPRSAGSPTSASNIKTKWRNNQVSDSNESDGSNDTPRRKLEDVPQGRKLPALELVDASQKANTLEPLEVNETKKLKKKKKRRSKEEKAQVDGEY